MTEFSRHICVVEDDAPVREALSRLLHALGHEVHSFASAEEFTADGPESPCGCLLLDVRLPGISGIALYEQLRAKTPKVPVVFLTGHGDVPLAVEAMKKGAVDFLTKPVDENVLISALDKALAVHDAVCVQESHKKAIRDRLACLTPREMDVMKEVITGAQNKQIASNLGIALKTGKIHRSRVMAKMEAESVVDLANMATLAEID
jgi:FixJ family two-component response regulator